MYEEAIFIGWKRPVPGKESAAIELLGMATSFFQKEKRADNITDVQTVFLSAHAGDLNGFVLVRGEPAKLDALRRDDDFVNIAMKSTIVLEGFCIIPSYVGESLQKYLAAYQRAI